MPTCTNGHLNADGTKFCTQCGGGISTAGPGQYCQKCGVATQGNAFCANCGSATTLQEKVAQNASQTPASFNGLSTMNLVGGSETSHKWIVGLSIAAAVAALLAAFTSGVNLPDGSSLNAFHLGANFTSTQYGSELISLGVASLLLAVRARRIATWPTWSHWLRLAFGVLWIVGADHYVSYCRDYVAVYDYVSTIGAATVGPAGGLALIAAGLYLAASIVNLVARRKQKNS